MSFKRSKMLIKRSKRLNYMKNVNFNRKSQYILTFSIFVDHFPCIFNLFQSNSKILMESGQILIKIIVTSKNLALNLNKNLVKIQFKFD